MKKYKILISAYTCSPIRGSEPGVGWNFVKSISKFHEVHVIVEKKKWQKEINEYLEINPHSKDNLNFYFIKKSRNKMLRKLWPPSYYWFYKGWQKEAFILSKKLHNKENFDIAHQLTMVGYREPSYLWKLNIPFVWGPIGGLEITPWSFLPSMGLKGCLHFFSRNIINQFQKYFLQRPKNAALRANNFLIAATPSNREEIYKLWKKQSEVICEVGQVNFNEYKPLRRSDEKIKILWSGIHEPRKNLSLLLKSLSISNIPFELHVLGKGTETKKWKKQSINLGIADKCVWHGWIERDKTFDLYKTSHLFCITSLHDLTSTVTLESLSFGLPIVCLDHCGFAEVVNDSCGIKIPLTTPKKVVVAFYNALVKLYENEDLRFKLAKGAITRAEDFSWDKKIDKLNNIYNIVLNEK